MEKEEVLEVEDQIQKALEKESKSNKEDDKEDIIEKSSSKSTVPATPVTVEKKLGKEELEDTSDSVNGTATSNSGIKTTNANLKDTEVPKTPLATSVPPSPKKAEGSKHL